MQSPNSQSKTFNSNKSGKTLFQIQFESSGGFQPILTRKNRKLDKFTFQRHTSIMRNLKLKIQSIKSGANTTERKKNPYDTGVHPALFFRKPYQNTKPMDYLDISSRPIIGNQRKLVSVSGLTTVITPPPKKIKFSYANSRSQVHSPRHYNNTGTTFAMDSMDAELYIDDTYKSSAKQSSDLYDHLRKAGHRYDDY